MASKTASWKQKVDPAFVTFIKFYLSFLEQFKLPSNEGYLSMQLPDNYLHKLEIEGFPGVASIYEHDKPEDSNYDLITMLDDTFERKDFEKITREVKRNKNSFFEMLLWTAGQLEEEDGREYYLKKFAPIKSENSYKAHIESMNEEKLKEWQKDFISDRQSLLWHTVVKGIEHVKENIDTKRKAIVKRFNEQPRIFKRSIFLVWHTISLLVHKKGIKKLFDEARKGDDESLFKLLQIDKTLFDHDWVRVRIRKASYFGDLAFFDKMSKAINTDPLKNRKIHGDIFLILVQFWTVGLYRLTIPEIIEILEASGARMQYDEVNFRKFVDREIKPLFKGW